MKRNAKQSGSGGRLRLGLLLATAAAFLLVPAAAASAFPVHVVLEGEGSGTVVNGEFTDEVTKVTTPKGADINCHYDGATQTGDCTGGTFTESGLQGYIVERETEAGSEAEPVVVEGGVSIFCEEGEFPDYCSAITFGPEMTFRQKFNLEPVPPANVTPPTISGTAKEGKTLIGNPGTWAGGPETFTHQWLRCNALGEACVPIALATGTEYVVTAEDVGSTIRFEETATNGLGSASATSAQTAVVVGAKAGSSEDSKEGEVYGEVEQETSLLESTCKEVFLGVFKAGVEDEYENSCFVTATSTGQKTSLSAADEGAEAVGKLVNGSYSLAQLLEAQATDTESLGGVSTGFGTMETPYTLLNWAVPVSADLVKVDFKQPIGKHDPLHTGTYAKTITLTLKQTLP